MVLVIAILFLQLKDMCYTDELCSRIVNGRMLNLKLYTQRSQTLTPLLHFTNLFGKEICLSLQNKCKVSSIENMPARLLLFIKEY